MLVKKPILGALWLSVTIVALGLVTRWSGLFTTVPEGKIVEILQFNLRHSKASIYSLDHLAEYLMSPLSWGVWVLLFMTYLITIWSTGRLNFIRPSQIFALFLLAGAILSVAFDLLFFRAIQNSLQLDVAGQFSINITFSGLLLVAGISYLAWAIFNRNLYLKSQYQLSPWEIPRLQINALPRGVDNVHIDVLLSHRFCKKDLQTAY